MEILQLVDQLEDVLNRGWRIPFSASLIVNEEECLRLIDQMRITVPSAIKESERMLAERNRILGEAQTQADALLARAQQGAAELVSQHYITQEAQQEAQRIVDLGRAEADRMVQEAEDYTLSVLRQLVDQLTGVLQQAENGIQAIEESRAAPPSSEPSPGESAEAGAETQV